MSLDMLIELYLLDVIVFVGYIAETFIFAYSCGQMNGRIS